MNDLSDWERYAVRAYGRLPDTREQARALFYEFESLPSEEKVRRHKEAEETMHNLRTKSSIPLPDRD